MDEESGASTGEDECHQHKGDGSGKGWEYWDE